MKNLSNLKVAIVYDRVNTSYGGAEQVLLAIQEMFPQATLFTSVYDPKKALWAKKFRKVESSFLNKIKFLRNKHQWLAFFMPIAFESLDLSQYSLIISVTSAEAKGVITNPDQLHICYLLSPPRYLFQFKNNYLNSKKILKLPLVKPVANLLLNYLCWWDQAAIHRPDVLIPLSKVIAKRAREAYQLKISEHLYPPVNMIALSTDDNLLKPLNLPKNFNLVVSRLVFYKRVDLAIKACATLNQNLVIVGEGTQKNMLETLAVKLSKGSTSKIIFLPSQAQEKVNSLMKKADLFLSLGVDDFGLAPLQANLFGTRALVNQQSGVAEIYQQLDLGGTITNTTLKEVSNKITQTSSKKIKSANIETVKKICGKKQFQLQLLRIINSNL